MGSRRRADSARRARIDDLGSEDPGGEDREQEQAERKNRGQRWRAKDREGVPPSHRKPAFAPPAHLIEADGDEGTDQRKACGERERQMQRIAE